MDPLTHAQTAAIELPNDIQTPELISQFPIAIGWWLLILIFIVCTLITIKFVKNYREINRIKKQAIQAINVTKSTIPDTLSTLKWAAMAYFSRQEIAALSGKKLTDYLAEQLPSHEQANFNKQSLMIIEGLYKQNSNNVIDAEFNQAALSWLKKALPPRRSVHQTSNSPIGNAKKQSLVINGDES